MTSQDNGKPELWDRCGCILRSRCCGGRGEDRDKSKQRDWDFYHLTQNLRLNKGADLNCSPLHDVARQLDLFIYRHWPARAMAYPEVGPGERWK